MVKVVEVIGPLHGLKTISRIAEQANLQLQAISGCKRALSVSSLSRITSKAARMITSLVRSGKHAFNVNLRHIQAIAVWRNARDGHRGESADLPTSRITLSDATGAVCCGAGDVG